MTDLRRLFEREMRALAEEGAAFASEYPEAARGLDGAGTDDRDPYVERIVEGVAFLAARIRQEMEIHGDPLVEPLLEQMAPDLVAPLPSVAVVAFALRPEAAEGVTLAAGTRILSEPLEGVASPLVFTLADPVEVHRTRVAAARWVPGERDDGFLELELSWDDLDPAPSWPDPLDLYLEGDAPVVWALRFALLRRAKAIEIRRGGSWRAASGLRILRREGRSYNADRLPPSPFAEVRDFLCADERFRFVRLVGLLGMGSADPDASNSVKLRIAFEGSPPRELVRSVRPERFRTCAGVAVNRYEATCEPLVWDHTRSEMDLRPVGGGHREILELGSVRAVSARGEFPPETCHRYGDHRHHSGGVWFQLVRRRAAKERIATRLAVGRSDLGPLPQEQILSIEAICGDGDVPHDRLRPEALNRVDADAAPRLVAKAVTRPTPVHRLAGAAASRLLCFASGHDQGWLDAERLKDGLRHCQGEQTSGKQTLIEAIREVAVEHGHILAGGVPWREMRTVIRLRDTTCTPETWDRLGQIDAFGSVLWSLVRDEVPIGSKARMELRVDPAGVSLIWSD